MTRRGADSGTTTMCLSEDVVVGFLDGSLPRDERERVELHVDACAACFGWMAALVRASLLTSRGILADTLPLGDSSPPSVESGDGPSSPGANIGRYRVVEQLGRGAMGVVYRAFDPILERSVAVKIMRGAPSSRLRLRALEEAQALAKLQHPNVIAVHDVGFFGEQVFVAMELVEGTTLAGWLRTERRWQEVRDVFLQAARGLGAAHAAGLVHRDFKPENVLLSSDGSRVVVTDFGLVCSLNVDGGASAGGEIAGTPAYMAPEQFEGDPVDRRTDVFNFCAALYEALFSQPAFAGQTADERRAAVSAGRLRPLDKARSPRWLHQALLRGLERRPEDRYGSIDELMAALEHDRRVRRALWTSATLAAFLIVALASAALASLRNPATACRRHASAITGAWSPSARARVATAFARSGAPYSARAFETLASILDRYVLDWRHAYEGACDATYNRGEQSPQALELRVECLDVLRDDVGQLVDRLASADTSVVERAVRATSALDPPATCERERPSPQRLVPPQLKREVEAARRTLAEARSYELVAKFADAERVVTTLLPSVRTLGFAPLVAETFQLYAYIRRDRGKAPDAERAFLEAYDAAERSGADLLRADIAIELVSVVGHFEARFADARRWAAEAEAILARLGKVSEEKQAALAMNRGLVAETEGKLDEAERELRTAFELRRHALSLDNPAVPMTLGNLGVLYLDQGRYVEARSVFVVAYAQMEKLVGPTHPMSLVTKGNIANAEYWLGHYREAHRLWLEVLGPQTRLLGPEHPKVVLTLDSIADSESCVGDYESAIVHGKQALDAAVANDANDPRVADLQMSLALYYSQHGDPEQARPLAEASLARSVAQFGAESPRVGLAEHGLARVALDAHDLAGAREHAERALLLLERGYGPRHPRTAVTVDLLGLIDYEAGHYASAIEKHERARAVLEPLGHAALPDVLTNLGRAQLASGHRDKARALLEKARALRQKVEGDPQAEATTAFALARALPADSADESRTLASGALRGFLDGGRRFERETREVRQWLQDHPSTKENP